MKNQISIVRSIILEKLSFYSVDRIPEPELIMENSQSVNEFEEGSRAGVLLPLNLFYLRQAMGLIRPGDTVLDFGCGPASYLTMQASLFPKTRFVGVDLSSKMLQKAEQSIKNLELNNIDLIQGDICSLSKLNIPTPDLIQSENCLHHLKDLEQLQICFQEVEVLMNENTALFIFDLCRFKSGKTMQSMADGLKGEAGEFLQRDFLHSMQASFSFQEFKKAASSLTHKDVTLYRMKILPMYIALCTPPRHEPDTDTKRAFKKVLDSLTGSQKLVFTQLSALFSLAGLRSRP